MQKTDPKTASRQAGALARTLVLAMALATMPAAVPFLTDDGAAFAKNGNGGGNGGGNGHAADKGKSAGKGKAQKNAAPTVTEASLTTEPAAPLHPSELGKWNASKANQAALDAHIRNQNFNGTIGALAQFQLAAKAAAGEELTDEELAALDAFVGDETVEISDEELADFLNGGAIEGDPVYAVDGGVVGCTANCDGVDLAAAQAEADAEAARLAGEAEQAALDGFLNDSEARIVDESNKSLSPERTEDLLDELADRLGVTRAPVEDELTDASSLTDPPVTTVQ